MTLTTDDPAYRELRVPVRVAKRSPGAVAVSPDAVALRFAAGQAEASGGGRRPVAGRRGGAGREGRVRRPGGPAAVVARCRPGGDGPGDAAAGKAGRAEVRVLFAEPAGHTAVVPVIWSGD